MIAILTSCLIPADFLGNPNRNALLLGQVIDHHVERDASR